MSNYQGEEEGRKLGEKKPVDALIEGGKATAGVPLGPALGPLGVNVMQIVNRINELTKAYAGMKVPVKVIVEVEDKSFDVEIGTPTTSALLVKELGVEKGSGTPKATKVGNLTPEAIVKVAQMKSPDSYAKNLRNEGKYDQVLAGSDGKDVREKEE